MQYQKNEKIEYTFNPNGRSRISSDSVDYIGDCECNPEDHPTKITHISMFHDKEMNRFCTRYTPESSIKNDQSTINCKNLHGSYGTKGAEAYCKNMCEHFGGSASRDYHDRCRCQYGKIQKLRNKIKNIYFDICPVQYDVQYDDYLYNNYYSDDYLSVQGIQSSGFYG